MYPKFNPQHKKAIVVHGIYQSAVITEKKFADGCIHVVYGGTFDSKKGGALAAAGVGRYLSKEYVVHICGFGSEADKEKVLEVINEVNKTSESQTIFEGQLNGDDYAKFIQKCHIGLSTQNPFGAFNDTSFPSKILVYLSNGLDVVTINIPVVKTSSVSDYLYFYDKQTSKSIAEAIKNVRIGELQYSDILKSLDKQFVDNIGKLLA